MKIWQGLDHGFYWVLFDFEELAWEICHWDGSSWLRAGIEQSWNEKIVRVGPRVQPEAEDSLEGFRIGATQAIWWVSLEIGGLLRNAVDEGQCQKGVADKFADSIRRLWGEMGVMGPYPDRLRSPTVINDTRV